MSWKKEKKNSVLSTSLVHMQCSQSPFSISHGSLFLSNPVTSQTHTPITSSELVSSSAPASSELLIDHFAQHRQDLTILPLSLTSR